MLPTIQAVTPLAVPQGVGLSGVVRTAPVAPVSAPADATTPQDDPPLSETVAALNRHAEAQGTDLSFHIDDDLGRVVVTVTDRRDGSVLRQIPSEEALQLARHLQDPSGRVIAAVA